MILKHNFLFYTKHKTCLDPNFQLIGQTVVKPHDSVVATNERKETKTIYTLKTKQKKKNRKTN